MTIDREHVERIVREVVDESARSDPGRVRHDEKDTIALGADHGGYALKEMLKRYLTEELGYRVRDFGTDSEASCDYPDFAVKVAEAVANGECSRGIMIDGAGIGSSMAANKVRGVLAACCHDVATVVNSREHNNANVLTLGARVVGRGLARQMVRVWLTTEFAGGRHERRVRKILDLEERWTERNSSRG